MPVLEAVAASMARTLGVAAGRSRRARYIQRIRAYQTLADELEPKDPDSARTLRAVGAAWVTRLSDLEMAALARRVEPGTVFGYLLLLGIDAIPAYFAFKYSGFWTWPVLILCGFIALLILGTAYSQFTEMPGAEDTPRRSLTVQFAPCERARYRGGLRNQVG
jgi:hypothetical protein